jgi:predicted nucleotidyltransferase
MRDDFPKEVKDFFYQLEDYLDTKLNFYGSVNRSDYVHDKSDIDIAIFTDNEYSIMSKLQHFLHVNPNSFDKVAWKLNGDMIYGYKIKCENYIDIKCEIAIYNNKFKPIVFKEIKQYDTVPIHISILLLILKSLYYTFPIISKKNYLICKRYIFNNIMLNKKESEFFLIPQ